MIRFAHTNIISTNWKELAEFYVNTFDCSIVPPIRKLSGEWLDKGAGLQDVQLEGAHLLLPGHGETGPTLEIFQYRDMEEQAAIMPNKRGFGHIAFEVDDVPAMLQKLIANGGQKLGKITQKEVPGAGELTFTYARDPEGNIIEIQQWN